MNDEHLATILRCIDANQSTLEVLKLAGFVNIFGHGLEPLRTSSSIRQIDLSLVGQFESPEIIVEEEEEMERKRKKVNAKKEKKKTLTVAKQVNISVDMILPILQGIIDNGRNSLRDVMFPHKFWGGRGGDAFTQFRNNFEQYLYRLSLPCQCTNHSSRCPQVIGPDYQLPDMQ